nr:MULTISPECIES: hypothetical protein [Brevundimonas]
MHHHSDRSRQAAVSDGPDAIRPPERGGNLLYAIVVEFIFGSREDATFAAANMPDHVAERLNPHQCVGKRLVTYRLNASGH